MTPGNRVIFWDFDGTLAHRPERWAGTMAAVLAMEAPGWDVSADDLRPYINEGFYWHTPDVPHADLVDANDYWASLERVFARVYSRVGVSGDVARRAAARVRERYVDPSGFLVFEDTRPALEALAAHGWRHRIISNHVPELPAIVEALGLTPAIEHVTNSATVGYEKPHAEIFRLALEAAGNPAQVWMVGDNIVADVLGAEAVGIRGVLVRRQDGRAPRSANNLADVLEVIEDSTD